MTFLVIPPVVALFTILGDIYPNGLSAPPLTVAQADSICGRVISRVAGKSITIFDLDAKRQVKLYAHGPLARGGFFPDANWTEANGYLISDVKVGDIVDLNIVKVGEFYRARCYAVVYACTVKRRRSLRGGSEISFGTRKNPVWVVNVCPQLRNTYSV